MQWVVLAVRLITFSSVHGNMFWYFVKCWNSDLCLVNTITTEEIDISVLYYDSRELSKRGKMTKYCMLILVMMINGGICKYIYIFPETYCSMLFGHVGICNDLIATPWQIRSTNFQSMFINTMRLFIRFVNSLYLRCFTFSFVYIYLDRQISFLKTQI